MSVLQRNVVSITSTCDKLHTHFFAKPDLVGDVDVGTRSRELSVNQRTSAVLLTAALLLAPSWMRNNLAWNTPHKVKSLEGVWYLALHGYLPMPGPG